MQRIRKYVKGKYKHLPKWPALFSQVRKLEYHTDKALGVLQWLIWARQKHQRFFYLEMFSCEIKGENMTVWLVVVGNMKCPLLHRIKLPINVTHLL